MIDYEKLDLQILLDEIKKHPDIEKAGWIGCFIGIVRGFSKEGEKVKKLHFEFSEEAEKKLEEIADEIRQRDGIVDVKIHHNTGDLKVGEEIIYVLVAGDHRHNIFPALRDTMELVKKKAPILKKEITETKEYWIHEE